MNSHEGGGFHEQSPEEGKKRETTTKKVKITYENKGKENNSLIKKIHQPALATKEKTRGNP